MNEFELYSCEKEFSFLRNTIFVSKINLIKSLIIFRRSGEYWRPQSSNSPSQKKPVKSNTPLNMINPIKDRGGGKQASLYQLFPCNFYKRKN